MLDSYRELLDELLGTPSAIRDAITEHGEPAIPDAAADVIAVVTGRDQAVLARLQSMTQRTDAYLPTLQIPERADRDVATLVEQLDQARGELVSLLMNLSLRDWERTAISEEDGEITLAEEVERHVDFDEEQLARFRELVQR
ncbi:MAG: hypothetical protein H0W59_01795 [Chloroflexia bacterium]|jgi:hypothetical protein|nr:hypothetical protein [Chloroflexia bacterium]